MTNKFITLFSIAIIASALSACDSNTESKTESKTESAPATETASKSNTEATTETSTAAEAITIIDPRIRALPPGQKVTAMYMQLQNSSANNHDLVKVEGDVSNMIELHTHTNNDGVMSMGEVESIPVPANTTAEAKPGSYHVMIMGLQKDLKMGEMVDFTLTFKDGSSKKISAEVKTLEMN